MTVGNISSANNNSPTVPLRKAAPQTQTPGQEALETSAQTKSEVAKGDPQAKVKLAQQQAAQANSQAAAADSDGDHDGSGGGLNVTA